MNARSSVSASWLERFNEAAPFEKEFLKREEAKDFRWRIQILENATQPVSLPH
jgi:hypothetical protein